MRSAAVAGVAALLAIAAGVASGAGPGSAKPFSAYTSCGLKGKHGDRFCFEGDHPVAVYRAFGRREVVYRVCARKSGRREQCAERRTNNPGQRSRTRIDQHGSGRYRLAWFEGGRAVDRDKLVIRERSVLLVGDSLSQGTKPYLPGALPSWRVEQSVSISRHAPQGVAILRRRGGLPGAIVFALGTNDDPRSVSSFRNALEASLGCCRRDSLRGRPQHRPPAGRWGELRGLQPRDRRPRARPREPPRRRLGGPGRTQPRLARRGRRARHRGRLSGTGQGDRKQVERC